MKASLTKFMLLSFVAASIPDSAQSLEIRTPKIPTVHIEIPHTPRVTDHAATPQLKGVNTSPHQRTVPDTTGPGAVITPASSGGANGTDSGGGIFNSNSATAGTGVPNPSLPVSVGGKRIHNSGTPEGAAEGGGIFNSNSAAGEAGSGGAAEGGGILNASSATGGAGSGGGIFNSNSTIGRTGVINSDTPLSVGEGPSERGENLKSGGVIRTNPDNPTIKDLTIHSGRSGTSSGGVTIGSSPSQIELGVNSKSTGGGSSGTNFGGVTVGNSPSQVELGVNAEGLTPSVSEISVGKTHPGKGGK